MHPARTLWQPIRHKPSQLADFGTLMQIAALEQALQSNAPQYATQSVQAMPVPQPLTTHERSDRPPLELTIPNPPDVRASSSSSDARVEQQVSVQNYLQLHTDVSSGGKPSSVIADEIRSDLQLLLTEQTARLRRSRDQFVSGEKDQVGVSTHSVEEYRKKHADAEMTLNYLLSVQQQHEAAAETCERAIRQVRTNLEVAKNRLESHCDAVLVDLHQYHQASLRTLEEDAVAKQKPLQEDLEILQRHTKEINRVVDTFKTKLKMESRARFLDSYRSMMDDAELVRELQPPSLVACGNITIDTAFPQPRLALEPKEKPVPSASAGKPPTPHAARQSSTAASVAQRDATIRDLMRAYKEQGRLLKAIVENPHNAELLAEIRRLKLNSSSGSVRSHQSHSQAHSQQQSRQSSSPASPLIVPRAASPAPSVPSVQMPHPQSVQQPIRAQKEVSEAHAPQQHVTRDSAATSIDVQQPSVVHGDTGSKLPTKSALEQQQFTSQTQARSQEHSGVSATGSTQSAGTPYPNSFPVQSADESTRYGLQLAAPQQQQQEYPQRQQQQQYQQQQQPQEHALRTASRREMFEVAGGQAEQNVRVSASSYQSLASQPPRQQSYENVSSEQRYPQSEPSYAYAQPEPLEARPLRDFLTDPYRMPVRSSAFLSTSTHPAGAYRASTATAPDNLEPLRTYTQPVQPGVSTTGFAQLAEDASLESSRPQHGSVLGFTQHAAGMPRIPVQDATFARRSASSLSPPRAPTLGSHQSLTAVGMDVSYSPPPPDPLGLVHRFPGGLTDFDDAYLRATTGATPVRPMAASAVAGAADLGRVVPQTEHDGGRTGTETRTRPPVARALYTAPTGPVASAPVHWQHPEYEFESTETRRSVMAAQPLSDMRTFPAAASSLQPSSAGRVHGSALGTFESYSAGRTFSPQRAAPTAVSSVAPHSATRRGGSATGGARWSPSRGRLGDAADAADAAADLLASSMTQYVK